MERWLVLRLDATGCAAEAQVNGMPVARLGASGGRIALAVHEYTTSGDNRLCLVIAPPGAGPALPPEPRAATDGMRASLVLALVQTGQAVVDPNARVLARKDWSPAAGEGFEAPLALGVDVALPVAFPRWRWLDAPVLPDSAATTRAVLEFVQHVASDFARGDPERYLAAARLRFDELALAYRRSASDLVQRFRDSMQAMYAAKALGVVPPAAGETQLRRVADGRLIECLGPTGEPALRTAPGPQGTAWPLRVTVVENRIYVLR